MKSSHLNKIKDYVSNPDTQVSKYEFGKLINTYRDKAELKNFIEDDWNEVIDNTNKEPKNLDHILKQIHEKIFDEIHGNLNSKLQTFIAFYSRVAAILLLPLIVISLFTISKRNNTIEQVVEQSSLVRIISPDGSRIKFDLPDGTIGFLNSGSSLEYKLPFKTHRHVSLDGEAYFDVAHDEAHKFVVSTKNVIIQVLGTKFNVDDYLDSDYAKVALAEGKISYQIPDSDIKGYLSPNHLVSIKDGIASTQVVNTNHYTAWTEGKLVIRGDNMKDMTERLSRWYQVDFIIADEQLYQYKFRATFSGEPIEHVMELLKQTSPIEYTIVPAEMLEDGSFSKKQISIFKK